MIEPQARAADRDGRLAVAANHRDGVRCAAVRVGTRVEVRNRFDARWSRGFEIAEVTGPNGAPVPRYRVRRRSDGSILPVEFDEDELREDKRRQTWWM